MVGLAVVAGLGLAACGNGTSPTSSPAVQPAPTPTILDVPPDTASVPLAGDAAAIVFMREEEKVARDVYTVLADTWDLGVFSTIAASEQTHMDAVETLLDRYDLADPAEGKGVGEFENQALQQLYDDLVARGRTSLVEVLNVGALIEEVDIVDLRDRASADPAVDTVFANLEQASMNHLRAFVTNLSRRGVDYTAVRLPAAEVAALVASTAGQGRG